jgi:hypothetical protein
LDSSRFHIYAKSRIPLSLWLNPFSGSFFPYYSCRPNTCFDYFCGLGCRALLELSILELGILGAGIGFIFELQYVNSRDVVFAAGTRFRYSMGSSSSVSAYPCQPSSSSSSIQFRQKKFITICSTSTHSLETDFSHNSQQLTYDSCRVFCMAFPSEYLTVDEANNHGLPSHDVFLGKFSETLFRKTNSPIPSEDYIVNWWQ